MAESTAAYMQQIVMQALSEPDSPQPPDTSIPAAAHCLQAYTRALQAGPKGESQYRLERAAKAAYRSAMPPLSGSRNIRDFVACVAHAMAIDAIDGRGGAKLLYAAQVANAAQNTQRRIKAKSNAITAPQTLQNQQLPNTESPLTQTQ